MTCKTTPIHNGYEALQCTQIKLEIAATFAGTWIELHQSMYFNRHNCTLAEFGGTSVRQFRRMV